MLVPGMRRGGGRGFPACMWNFSLRKRVSSHSLILFIKQTLVQEVGVGPAPWS